MTHNSPDCAIPYNVVPIRSRDSANHGHYCYICGEIMAVMATKPLAGSKLFPLDKNYILKEAQFVQRQELLTLLVKRAIQFYRQNHNPLGLVDDTIADINQSRAPRYNKLFEFYQDLAGIYRYLSPDNQLELMFDGRSQFDKFQEQWREQFLAWAEKFYQSPTFLRAVLEAAVLSEGEAKAQLAANRFKVFLAQHFNLKVYKYRGIQEFKSA